MSEKILSIFLLCALLVAFSGCTEKTDNPDPTEPTDLIIEVPDDPSVEEIPAVTEPEPEPVVTYINPLTGLETQKDLTTKRPVSIMINNIHAALPQIGISEADIIYEILEEGGITRLLCIYNDYSEIPEIGSVRSARDYFIDIADAHDAIFLHAGASKYAFAELAIRHTDNVDGLYATQFYRSAERRKTMATEHTLMISGSGIDEAISQKGYRTESDTPCPLAFSHNYSKGGQIANRITIPFSLGRNSNPYVTATFDYDENTGEYLKGEFNSPHIDGDDNQTLSFKNVISITCPANYIQGDDYGRIQVHFTGTGSGTYSVDGTHREIVWKKPSRSSAYTLYEADGETPLILCPGKSYIAIVPTGTNVSIN